MNELQRYAYLDAMGVDYYYPKLLLPGAKVSELCELPIGNEVNENAGYTDDNVEAKPASLTEERNTAEPAVSKGKNKSSEALYALFDDESDSKSSPKKKIENGRVSQVIESATQGVRTVAANERTVDSVPQFSLTIIRGANILIIDDGLDDTVKRPEYLQLVTNMLFAVGAKSQQLTLDTFNWPMVKKAQFDQSATAAKQTLESFLLKQISHLSLSYILILGDTAKPYLCEQSSANGQFINHKELSVELICTHSASQMMKDTATKKAAWFDLQPLHRVLKKK